MKVKCLNCGNEFELKDIYEDNMGTFTVCQECGGSFDVDIIDKTEEEKEFEAVMNHYDEGCKKWAELFAKIN